MRRGHEPPAPPSLSCASFLCATNAAFRANDTSLVFNGVLGLAVIELFLLLLASTHS